MKPIIGEHNHVCCKRKQHSSKDWGKTETSTCGKAATHQRGNQFFCRHHSKTGRFVVRDGDVGEILARFDTEKELRENISKFPGMRMQKVSKTSRRDIY